MQDMYRKITMTMMMTMVAAVAAVGAVGAVGGEPTDAMQLVRFDAVSAV